MRQLLPITFTYSKLRLKPALHVALICLLITGGVWWGWQKIAQAQDAQLACIGAAITVPGVEKKLIDNTAVRQLGNCVTPDLLFMHATDSPGGTLDSNWNYFNEGSDGQNVNAQFIIGTDGKIYQTVELYPKMVEFARTNDPFNNRSIGIEMVSDSLEFDGKAAMPPAQYSAALSLVQFLMKQYNIPLGEREYDWNTCDPQSPIKTGVFGHYQICKTTHTDPGQNWLKDFRADLKSGVGSSTSTGNPALPAGRWVPYDAYARPFSWPISGHILQNYGFTDQAQNLGARYPSLYPKGDPGVIFSITNHVEPPPNATADKFINPNIDIAPNGTDQLARAVYSTHAGWITYADWAGDSKGYTIQVESDVDGDGQADLATRYMRLQEPTGGFFAPDIALFHPKTNTGSLDTSNGECADPSNNDWTLVNSWDDLILKGIAAIKAKEGAAPPCNLVKAMMQLESGGKQLDPNYAGYLGLMQVGPGSNCDSEYDINTNEGNINCGIQHLTRDYNSQCNKSWDGAVLAYFTGSCTGNGNACDQFNCADDYIRIVKENWDYLNSQVAQAPPPDVPNPDTQDSTPPATEAAQTPLPPPYILEAETMDHTISTVLVHDAAAGSGQAFEIRGNSEITKTLTQTADQVTVRARADICGGSPTMVLKMDGTEFGRFEVDTEDWANFSVQAPFDGASHLYSIEYINDFAVLSGLLCDRNLYIDSTTFKVTNANTTSTKTLSETTIEAESLETLATASDTLPEVKSDLKASNLHYVAMVDSSSISGKVTFAKGNWIKVFARGTECQGSPHMVVKLDNATILETDVTSTSWTAYSTTLNIPVTATGSDHEMSVAFTNDKYLGPWCDRNLDVDFMKVQDNSVSQSPTNANSLIGKTKYVGFNQLLGYVSVALQREHGTTNSTAIPNANQTYMSYRIMYNNPNTTTFPTPDAPDSFINARVDNPYIIETADNTMAGSLKVAFDHINDPMWFFCALRTTGNSVKCIDAPNP